MMNAVEAGFYGRWLLSKLVDKDTGCYGD